MSVLLSAMPLFACSRVNGGDRRRTGRTRTTSTTTSTSATTSPVVTTDAAGDEVQSPYRGAAPEHPSGSTDVEGQTAGFDASEVPPLPPSVVSWLAAPASAADIDWSYAWPPD